METINELKALKEEYKNIFAELNAKLDNKIAELEKAEQQISRRWKPKFRGAYYCIINGAILLTYWIDCASDKLRYATGNVFKTEEEATFEIERRRVLIELKEYADDTQEWNSCNEHWSIVYDFRSGKVKPVYNTSFLYDAPYFSSKEQTQKIIETIGKDRLKKYYFKLEG